jgi:two-component system sensor histidine kinase UhpB
MAERERHQAWIDAQEERLEAILQVQHELAEREAMRRELLRHTVLAQEEERTRIARELHDETAQFLTTLSLDLATVQKHFNPQSQPYSLLERLQRLSSQMSEGIHRMVHDLRPAQLDDLGLAAGLRYLVDETRRQGLRVEIEFTGQRQRLDPLVETVCFRIAQEAFTNTIRHAHAHRVKIHLAYLSQKVLLQIQDDGIGFDPTKRQIGQPGLGLAGMQERAESVGGILRIDSSPGHGTLVECTIPAAYVQAQEVSAYEDHSHPVG